MGFLGCKDMTTITLYETKRKTGTGSIISAWGIKSAEKPNCRTDLKVRDLLTFTSDAKQLH
jgi:hypothetical protein